MADFTAAPVAGDVPNDSQFRTASTQAPNRLTMLTNVTGAVVSLALVAGVGVWGYKLLVRDVSGIPVVRAIEGEMRVRPEEPGGQLAEHQGLSVNTVAAIGVAGAPADELRLAPQSADITEEDMARPAPDVATVQQAVATPEDLRTVPDVAAALQTGDVETLVDKLTDGIEPLDDLVDGDADPEEIVATVTEAVITDLAEAEAAAEAEAEVTRAVVTLDAPGVRSSLRPRKRPAQRAVLTNAALTSTDAAPQAAPAAAAAEVDADALPAGTRLAQLGAFDSEAVAREQWDQLSSRFAAYLGDKSRVVQKASSGGRTFYRLRAMGFEDLADARRFCSALVAEDADCIPVVTR